MYGLGGNAGEGQENFIWDRGEAGLMERSRQGVLYVKEVDYLNRELQDQISLASGQPQDYFFHHAEYDGEFKPPAFAADSCDR